MTRTTFHMDNALDAVDPMVLALTAHVEGDLAAEARFRFELCLSEALSNVVLHGRLAEVGAPVDIVLDVAAQAVTVDVFEPRGTEPFDVTAMAPDIADVDPLATGGRGLGLIMECADAVEYGASEHRHRLRLTFESRAEPEHAALQGGTRHGE